LRLAMWSGPRNISTALMRSWGNRPDTFVCDEPLYAHYLLNTGLPHPGAQEVIRRHEPDWRKVTAWLTGEIPEGKTIFYQKHMAHHLLPHIERDWLAELTHCFLIREPREMLTSLVQILPEPALEDTGLPQQLELFEWTRGRTGTAPPVLDARDVLENPRAMLETLCRVLDVPFLEAMLSWPPGPRSTDGVWAKHWYGAVERTTTFQPYTLKPDLVPEQLTGLLQECEALYQELYPHRLLPERRHDETDVG
jgi:sulfotransferase family protein